MSLPKSSRSPWSRLNEVRQARIAPAGRVSGEIVLPGSKSVTNRALLLAGAAKGESRLTGLLRSDDSYWCVNLLRQCGVDASFDGEELRIGGSGGWRSASEPLYIGSAGTIARFLPGLLCAASGNWEVHASEQLSRRPLAPLIEALRTLGGAIEPVEEAGRLPLRIEGPSLRGGTVRMSGALSSQFISGVLLAAPLAAQGATVEIVDEIVQQDYVAITIDMMRAFGAQVEVDAAFRRFRVEPGAYRGRALAIEADASTATYFLALAALKGGPLTVLNLDPGTLQPDIRFIDVLRQMGCRIETQGRGVTVAAPERLRGGFTLDMRPMSDATLTVAAMAPFADGPISIRGVEHIRAHESDRISVMVQALRALGIAVEEHRDGLTVQPGTPRFAELDTHDDHRVAMSLAVLGAAGAGVALIDPGCVSKTCPVFFDELERLGVAVSYEGRVG
ncbi:3-phosphoshikimate 1-carboxyvinyltransferase [Arenibaculum pallidiluteum]|uniref:3-phosphoshikimate 1-carboxyvinyltransferase n=1 Tax=Arenibaculum pallidiluteum TaxID=2812559 RepID=UPI001A964E09|nr:3-phosphoshikimate 1-carboxyvinyltransferase [Arenibaculum pallidiluteum]